MIAFKKHWPLFASIFLLWTVSAFCLALSLHRNQGHFVYALDDAYIHMAMAKNFSQDGVWGISRYNFSSSSSSPLWTLLLSFLYILFGANELTPLILNFLFATLLCGVSYRLIRKRGALNGFNFLVLVCLIFFTPLITLMFSGQEHILHALLTILFIYLSATLLSRETSTGWQRFGPFFLAPLLTSVRYEGLFPVLVAAGLFGLKRKWWSVLLLTGLGVLPVVALGCLSLANGWHFLPNPVLLKGNLPDFSSFDGIWHFFGIFMVQLKDSTTIFMLFIGALATFLYRYEKQKGIWKDTILMLAIFLGVLLVHLAFARLGHFFRYEAYLIAAGFFAIGVALADSLPRPFHFETARNSLPRYVAGTVLLLMWLAPFLQRGIQTLYRTPRATANIYQQQYQMGLFLKEFYRGQTVAANDIGAINYLADIRCLDLWGLANLEAANLRRFGNDKAREIEQLARAKGTRIAVVYDHWFSQNGESQIPKSWKKAGIWKISDNVVCGGDSVSFYAVDSSTMEDLIKNMKSFAPRLPKNVQQSGPYITGNF